jgi:Ala-tRNA(Pro) deacylase
MNYVFQNIYDLLTEKGIVFETKQHEPTYTSEQSASARGEDLKVGAKAILMKTDDVFSLFVLSASLKVDSKRVKEVLKVKKTRFATSEELFKSVGLVPGSVPPFGRPILPFSLYIDKSVESLEKVAFNAGSLTMSVIMSAKDYLSVAEGKIFDFSAAAE